MHYESYSVFYYREGCTGVKLQGGLWIHQYIMGTPLYVVLQGRLWVHQCLMGTPLYCVTGSVMGTSVYRCCVTWRAIGT